MGVSLKVLLHAALLTISINLQAADIEKKDVDMWPMNNVVHQKIFCGRHEDAIPAHYSLAMAEALRRAQAHGESITVTIERLQKAACGSGFISPE